MNTHEDTTRSVLRLRQEQFTTSRDGTLVTEISDLQLRQLPRQFEVDGVLFMFTRPDYNGDDVAGWNFQSRNGRRALIIND